eukprot:1159621-Prymnesium_polylepis.1
MARPNRLPKSRSPSTSGPPAARRPRRRPQNWHPVAKLQRLQQPPSRNRRPRLRAIPFSRPSRWRER